MTHITLPRAIVEQVRQALTVLLDHLDGVPADQVALADWIQAEADLCSALAQQAEPVAWANIDSDRVSVDPATGIISIGAQQAEPVGARALIEECRAAFAQELAAWDIDPPLHHVKQAHDKCEAWLAALAQQAEPVEPRRWEGDHNVESPFNACMHKSYCITLKQAPPQRKPLTDEEIAVLEAKYAPPVHPDFADSDDWVDFARAIERAHGIGDSK